MQLLLFEDARARARARAAERRRRAAEGAGAAPKGAAGAAAAEGAEGIAAAAAEGVAAAVRPAFELVTKLPIVVDGQDVFAVYEAAGEAFRRARDGEGPTLLECQTYRYYGHFEGDEIKYRTRDEEDHYRSQDCLERFREVVLEGGLLESEELDAIDREAETAIVDAVAFAESSPLPDPAECLEDVYVTY